MEFNVILKNVFDQISDDRELVRLNFVGANEDVAQVDLSLESLRGLANYLVHLADKHGAADAGPDASRITGGTIA